MTRQFNNAALAAALALLLCDSAGAADLDRHITDGTLSYRIVLDGRGGEPPKFPMLHDAAILHRSLKVSTHLHGIVSTPDSAAPKAGSTIAQLQAQLEACGEDQACGMAIAMEMMKSPDKMAALQRAGDRMVDDIGRDTVWGEDMSFCHRVGHVRSTEEMLYQDIGEGYSEEVKGNAVRAGDVDDDCLVNRDVASIALDAASNHYTLVLPAFVVPTELDDKTRGVTRAEVGGPTITIKDLPYADGKTLRGEKTYKALFYVDETPAYGRKVHIPMHAKVTWEFIPD